MITVNPYLSFNGTCEAAFDFYKSVFGGSFSGPFRYKDMPSEQPIPESEKEKILHISLSIGNNVTLMGADTSKAFGNITTFGDSIALSINPGSETEAKRIFDALSKGGKIIMPLEKTFWADLYGMFTDKFGINWMVNYSKEKM